MSAVKLSSLALPTGGFLSHQDQETQDSQRLYLNGNLKCDLLKLGFTQEKLQGNIPEARRKPRQAHGCVKTCRMKGQLRVQPLEPEGTGA